MRAGPTIADVADAAGVSKGLVSFALNGRPGVAPATRDRILEAAGTLGWRPSLQGRALSNRRAYAVGLVIARGTEVVAADPFYPSFIAGAEQILVAAGHALVLSVVGGSGDETEVYRRFATDHRVDGVFVTDLRVGDGRFDLLADLGLPAVAVGRSDHHGAAAVVVDDTVGIRATVAHLAGLGHRRIAYVAGPRALLHGARRMDAFVHAVTELRTDAPTVVETDFSPGAAARATEELLDLAAAPTAILYGNDLAAVAGLGVAGARGLRVPDDLSVAGFDDSETARWMRPALTTVETRPMQWGGRAAEALLDVVAGRPVTDVAMEPARLVVRDSTGPAPR